MLKSIFHIHLFNTPIASQYVGFHTRNIVYECRCGKRKMKIIVRAFSDKFPIKTNSLISDKEMQKILQHQKHFKSIKQ